jgi:hypothetical protein
MIACSCALVAGVAGGCGAGTLTVTDTTTTTTTATVTETVARTVTVRAPTATTTAAAAPVTATSSTPLQTAGQPTNSLRVHDFSGNTLDVTVNGVIPVTPGPAGFAPVAGDRLVALSLTLTDAGPGTISSDANTDATLTGTDGLAYTADFDVVGQCTNFSHGNYTLRDGATASGCVVFQIPLAVSDRSVQFSLGDGSVQFNKS